MIKKYCVSDLKPFKYLFEVYNTDTKKLKYMIATGRVIQVDSNLNSKSNNIVKIFDNLNDALGEYNK